MNMIDYNAFNKTVFERVPISAKCILDVGCGTGVMGKALKEQNSARRVDGITYSKNEYEIAKLFLNEVIIADINNELPVLQMKEYDCILFSHIIEHTFQPEQVLLNFSKFLTDEGIIIVALPNVLQYKQRFEFLKGNFRYSSKGGVMDETHFRFFDWVSAQELIKQASLKIISKESNGNFPLSFLRKIFRNNANTIDRFFLKHWPGLFGFQFVFVLKK